MTRQLLFALWAFLPAGLANAAPVFAAKIPGLAAWNAPLDFGASWRGARIFGPHKTWRGLISGMVVATLALWAQQLLFEHSEFIQAISLDVDYAHMPLLIAGPLFGLGALAGDAIESFFKRQRGLPSGASWFPFDQIDYILGGIIATAPFLRLDFGQISIVLLVWTIMHLIVSYIGYKVRLKDAPI